MIRLMVGRALEAHFPELPPVAADAAGASGGARFARRQQRRTACRSRCAPARSSAWPDSSARGAPRSCARSPAPTSPTGGEIAVDGTAGRACAARTAAIEAGIAFITEDRKAQGLVLGMTVRENTTLAHLAAVLARPVHRAARRKSAITNREIAELRIRTPSSEQTVRNLSGGNQQKVVLAKWLIGDARVFLFDEPTRGVDVGAKAEIYALMLQLLARGAGDRDGLERAARGARDVASRAGRARRQDRAPSSRAPMRRPAGVIAVAAGVAA